MKEKNFISATQGLPNVTSGQKEKDVVAQRAAFPAQNCLNCVDSLSAEMGQWVGNHCRIPGQTQEFLSCWVG